MTIEECKLVEILQEVAPSVGATYVRKLAPVRSRLDADDLMQITAMKAIANRESIKTSDVDEVRHWVRKIAKNEFSTAISENIKVAKRSVRRECGLEDCRVAARQSSLDLDLEAELGLVKLALQHIAKSQAVAVEMRYLEMAEYSEISMKLGCSVNAARLLVSRGIAAVRAVLERQAA